VAEQLLADFAVLGDAAAGPGVDHLVGPARFVGRGGATTRATPAAQDLLADLSVLEYASAGGRVDDLVAAAGGFRHGLSIRPQKKFF
jgi:hypothetical protein